MKKFAIAGIAALAIAGSTAVYAQHHHWVHGHTRMNPEDRAAFTDARIAAVHAGLKLNADQEKLWPPVETAVRDFAKLRIDRANARMNAPRRAIQQDAQKPDDPVTRLRERADNMATTAAAMKKIADAADPLYKTARRRPEAPPCRPDPYGAPVRRPRAGGSTGSMRGMDRDSTATAGSRLRSGSRSTGTASMDGGAGPERLCDRRPPACQISEKAAGIRRLFCFPFQRVRPGKLESSLLDIAGSLC